MSEQQEGVKNSSYSPGDVVSVARVCIEQSMKGPNQMERKLFAGKVSFLEEQFGIFRT